MIFDTLFVIIIQGWKRC